MARKRKLPELPPMPELQPPLTAARKLPELPPMPVATESVLTLTIREADLICSTLDVLCRSGIGLAACQQVAAVAAIISQANERRMLEQRQVMLTNGKPG